MPPDSEQTPTAGEEGPAGAALQEPGAGAERAQAAAPAESAEKRALHEIIHLWIPLAIVLVSVCAAIVGWRASLADESATHYEELSRQDLIQQQQQLIQDNASVDADVRTFGEFAQASALAHSLLHDAGVVGGPVGNQLRVDGGANLTIALALGKQIQDLDYAFDPSNATANSYLRSDGTYVPGHPYDAAAALTNQENADVALHGLEPEALLRRAESEHNRGVDLTGIAALFIGVLVLLTLAAVVKGQQKLWFAGSGAAVGTTALILFLVTELS